MPYLQKVADSVGADGKWWLYYYNDDDKIRADKMAVMLELNDYCLRQFEMVASLRDADRQGRR